MPYCANCGWRYEGQPRFCRECGRQVVRRPRPGETPSHLNALPVATAAPAAETARQRWIERIAVATLALLAGGSFLLIGAAASGIAASALPTDEAWVRLVYARNLAQTARLEFNAGQGDVGVGSLLWVGLMALLIKTFGAAGVSVVALAKATSLLASAAAATLALELARRATGSRLVAVATGMLVALDAAFGFTAAAGMEGTLFAALALGAMLAFLERRPLATGSLLALCVLTRLEGLALVALVALAWTATQLRRDRFVVAPRVALPIVAIGGPSVVALLFWMSADAPADRWLPQPLYVARALRPGLPLPDLLGLWQGYLGTWTPYASAWVVALPTMALGARALVRQLGWRGVPLALFAPLVLLGLSAVLPMPRTPWAFSLRRVADPLLPFLALAFVVGVHALWHHAQELWAQRWPERARARHRWSIAAAGAPLVVGALVAGSFAAAWGRLPEDYLRSARAMTDTYFAASLVARETLPEQALIASLEPGALRYVSRRPVADLKGLHTQTLAGRAPLDALAEARAEFAVLPRGSYFESWPGLRLIEEFGTTALPGSLGHVGLFRLVPGAGVSSREEVYAFPTAGLRRLDYLDVGDEASELAHNYQALVPREVVRRTLRVTEERAVTDDGRVSGGGEVLSLRAEAGRGLVVARRFDGAEPGGFRVSVDGQPVGEWWPRPGRFLIAEDTFRVAGGLVRQNRVTVRLELLPGSASQMTSYGYWSFAEGG